VRVTDEWYRQKTGKEPPPATSRLLDLQGETVNHGSQKRGHKFGAQETFVDGIRFGSKKEAADYRDLLAREAAGEVKDIRRQVLYNFHLRGERLEGYKADFVFYELRGCCWHEVVADSKPDMSTWSKKQKEAYLSRPAVRLATIKRQLMKLCHNIEVRIL
jgi:hypothetical protein